MTIQGFEYTVSGLELLWERFEVPSYGAKENPGGYSRSCYLDPSRISMWMTLRVQVPNNHILTQNLY